MMHGWQSESTDGPKGGWSVLELYFLEWLQSSPATAGCSVVNV